MENFHKNKFSKYAAETSAWPPFNFVKEHKIYSERHSGNSFINMILWGMIAKNFKKYNFISVFQVSFSLSSFFEKQKGAGTSY